MRHVGMAQAMGLLTFSWPKKNAQPLNLFICAERGRERERERGREKESGNLNIFGQMPIL
jgi:hypothetical protein